MADEAGYAGEDQSTVFQDPRRQRPSARREEGSVESQAEEEGKRSYLRYTFLGGSGGSSGPDQRSAMLRSLRARNQ